MKDALISELGIDSFDESIRPLEYTAHIVWAEAHGLAQLLRQASPEEIEENRAELVEAANKILALLESKQ